METTGIHEEEAAFTRFMASMDKLDSEFKELRVEIQEITAGIRETRIAHERFTESHRENIKRQDKENAERQKEIDRRFGLYDNRYGQMLEYMVKPNLIKGFRKLGFMVTKAYQDTEITDENDRPIAEIDFTLEDGNKVILVEIKSKLTTEDVSRHVERMGIVKNHASQRGDARMYLGAVGGLIINPKERDFALKNGFYVIQPSGETFAITVPEGPYSPREW